MTPKTPQIDDPRETNVSWCWAGLALIAVCGLSLAEARRLFSSTEGLAALDLGPWWRLGANGARSVRWAFQVTPQAAWWGIGLGSLMAALGWIADSRRQRVPFGNSGALLVLALAGVLLAENLLIAFFLSATCAVLGGLVLWSNDDEREELRRYFKRILICDSIGLVGVFLAGLGWGTFDLHPLRNPEFVQAGFAQRTAWCVLAGSCLFLCLLGRCGLFFVGGRDDVQTKNGRSVDALLRAFVWPICVWMPSLWMFGQVRLLIAVAPQTAFLAEGLSLLAAVMISFLAAAQTDPGRGLQLSGASQIAILLAALVLKDTGAGIGLALGGGALLLSSLLGMACGCCRTAGVSRWAMLIASAVAAGSPVAPTFWLIGGAVAAPSSPFSDAAPGESDSTGAASTPSADAASVQPLPLPIWCAGWWLCSLFSATAVCRAGRGADHSTELPPLGGLAILSNAVILLVVFAAGAAMWLTIREVVDLPWPLLGAVAASLAGCAPAFWNRNREILGGWAQLARREFYLPDLAEVFLLGPLKMMTEQAQVIERHGLPGLSRWIAVALPAKLVEAADELRDESPRFYAVTATVVIVGLVLVWVVA